MIVVTERRVHIENPHLLVPQRLVEEQQVPLAGRRPVFPPRDVVLEEAREPFFPVRLDELEGLLPKQVVYIKPSPLLIPAKGELLTTELAVKDEGTHIEGQKKTLLTDEQIAEIPVQQEVVADLPVEDQEGKEVAEPSALSALGFIFVSSEEVKDFTGETSNRPMQRALQYEMLANTLDKHERDEFVTFTKKGEGREYQMPTHILRRILETWYDNELAQEPLTKSIADGKNESRLPDPTAGLAAAEEIIRDHQLPRSEVILEAAEEIIRKHQLNEEEIIAAAEYILLKHKEMQVEVTQRTEESLKEEQEQLQEHQERKAEEEEVRSTEKALRDMEEQVNVEQARQVVESGELYIHDAVLDEPSQEAAAYVEELMNRSF